MHGMDFDDMMWHDMIVEIIGIVCSYRQLETAVSVKIKGQRWVTENVEMPSTLLPVQLNYR